MKKLFLIVIFLLITLVFSKNIVAENKPAENNRGLCDAWFSKDGKIWENTTAKTSLKLSQTFYIKVMVKAKINLKFLRYQLSCYGPPYDFELVESPNNLPTNSQILKHTGGREIADVLFSDVKANKVYTHIWKFRVKTNSTFAGGNTPINIDSFFFDGEDEKQLLFTALSVLIEDEIWDGYTEELKINNFKEDNSNKINKSSDFVFITFLIALFSTIITKKIR